MTIKATSLLALIAIWASTILAVIDEPDGWWAIIFAFLASGAIASRLWRSIGLSKLIAIAAIWAATGLAIAADPDATWVSIFAFLATGAVSFGVMRRDAIALGVGIAAAWAVVGVVTAQDEEAAWISIFAFLTAGALANSHGEWARGGSAVVWWGLAGGIMLAADGWYWLSIPAFLLSASSIGFGDFEIPRRIDWDFFDRDDDDEAGPRVVNPPRTP
ncbi:MAG: hypothetical protein WD557_00910 [Dehalococcoidia bacterium]